MIKPRPRTRSKAQQTEAPAVEITVGQLYVGAVLELGRGRHEAFDSQGRLIGVFPNVNAASDAVLHAWRQGGGS